MTNNDTSHLIPKEEESMTNYHHNITNHYVNSDNTELTFNSTHNEINAFPFKYLAKEGEVK